MAFSWVGVAFSWVGVVFCGPGDLTLSDLAGGAGLLGLAGTVWGGQYNYNMNVKTCLFRFQG